MHLFIKCVGEGWVCMIYSMKMEVREQLAGVSCCFYTVDPGSQLSGSLAAVPCPADLLNITVNSWSPRPAVCCSSSSHSHTILPALGEHFADKHDFSVPSSCSQWVLLALISSRTQTLRSLYSLHISVVIISSLNYLCIFITGPVSPVLILTVIYYDNNDQEYSKQDVRMHVFKYDIVYTKMYGYHMSNIMSKFKKLCVSLQILPVFTSDSMWELK